MVLFCILFCLRFRCERWDDEIRCWYEWTFGCNVLYCFPFAWYCIWSLEMKLRWAEMRWTVLIPSAASVVSKFEMKVEMSWDEMDCLDSFCRFNCPWSLEMKVEMSWDKMLRWMNVMWCLALLLQHQLSQKSWDERWDESRC